MVHAYAHHHRHQQQQLNKHYTVCQKGQLCALLPDWQVAASYGSPAEGLPVTGAAASELSSRPSTLGPSRGSSAVPGADGLER